MNGFSLQRLGLVMAPDPGNPLETEGVLNPAASRGPDRHLYLFPRLVAQDNYSRIGIARVRFNETGDPASIERLGIALEPEADYERLPNGGGGCEDPRITFVEPLRRYVMTYTALSSEGPRIAMAVSEDLFHWRRIGLVRFRPYQGIEFDSVDNKDASVFPTAIADPFRESTLAILDRPLFPGTRPEETAHYPTHRTVDLNRESIWISYCSTKMEDREERHLCEFGSHHRLATPSAPWERLKIGGGTPPVLTRHGWLIVYHGVAANTEPASDGTGLCYSAGLMVLSKEYPREICYRSTHPILTPESSHERQGTVGNVVFPTGIDRRDDLGSQERFDIYYGMADHRIGVARLGLPDSLPPKDSPTQGKQRSSVTHSRGEQTPLSLGYRRRC
jgi:beta-1,2-mannobiose phosphorylase / 1,2-beta-oligomannan phosphorylase